MKKLTLILLLFASPLPGVCQNCELIAQYGVYDTRTLNISRERAISFLSFFRKDTRMTFEEAKDYSASIGIPIETVMVSLGFSASETGYRQFVESVMAMTTYNEIFIEKVVATSRIINADILRVLQECYRIPGIHARIEHTEDPELSFLVLFFKWDGNHNPVTVEVAVSDRTGLSFDGVRLSGTRKSYLVGPDEERRISIKRTRNTTVGFTLRVTRQSGASVITRTGNMSIYKTKVQVTPTREYIVERIRKSELPRTPGARWLGGGDEELKRFETTELSGTFNLGVEGSKLVGNILATITEKVNNHTNFEIKHTYQLYTAPAGWRIVGYGVENEPFGSSMTALGPVRQSGWVSSPLFTTGPLQSYVWQGDSGRDQDQIEGCWIKPTLKEIVVLLEKN